MHAYFKSLGLTGTILLLSLIIGCSKEDLKDSDDQEIRSGEKNVILNSDSPSVTPKLYDEWSSGSASQECNQANAFCGFSWKINSNPRNRKYLTNTDEYENIPSGLPSTVTITNGNGKSFDWTSDFKVCAVIVYGGPTTNVYEYPQGACGDNHLTAPVNPVSGKNYIINNVTFCFTSTPCSATHECLQEEIAWTDGNLYTSRGDWATFTPYPGHCQYVDIYADETILAGAVSFRDNEDGTVEINFQLDHGFVFNIVDENIKVQDYDLTPSRKPTPNLFEHKATTPYKATTYTIIVPRNEFYGIHLNLANETPCDQQGAGN